MKNYQKITIVVRAGFPDQIGLFNAVAKLMPNVSMSIVMLRVKEASRTWDNINSCLKTIYAPGFTIKLFDKEIFFNYGINNILKNLSPDLIILTPWSELGIYQAKNWALKNSIPCIGFLMGPRRFSWSLFLKLRIYFTYFLVRLFSKDLKAIFCYGEGVKLALSQIIGSNLDANLVVTSHCVDHKNFEVLDPLKRFEIKMKFFSKFPQKPLGITFGFIGQLIERKGIDLLLAAFSILLKENANINLIIVGDGPLRTLVQEFLLKHPSHINYFKFLDETDVKAFYLSIDILVVPSRFEDWGHAVNESLSAGTPVLSSDCVYSSLDMIEDRVNGFIYNQSKQFGLLNAINDVILNRDLLAEMGKNASLTINKSWTVEKSAMRWVNALNSL